MNLPALETGGRRISFGELDRRSRAVAAMLWSRGVRRGDVVAALLRNGIPIVELLHGAYRCGAALLP
ncbi:MAG: AMP-binding protein, partial [Myxococcota bacterium]